MIGCVFDGCVSELEEEFGDFGMSSWRDFWLRRSAVLVYVTAPTQQEAEHLARITVDARLAACANIYSMKSVYHWQGRVVDDEEWALWLKTRRSMRHELVRHIIAHHSYECPCVVTVPLWIGHIPFAQWIAESTSH